MPYLLGGGGGGGVAQKRIGTGERGDISIQVKSCTCKVRACTPMQWLELKGSSGFKVKCISVF